MPVTRKRSNGTKKRPTKSIRKLGRGSSIAVVSVMLIVPDAEDAISWYKKALGARELWNLGGVAGLEIEGAPFYIHEVNPNNASEKSPVDAQATSVRVELFVDDPYIFMERAIAAGAIICSPIENHQVPWGIHRQGGFKDPFGHNWSVGDKSPLKRYMT